MRSLSALSIFSSAVRCPSSTSRRCRAAPDRGDRKRTCLLLQGLLKPGFVCVGGSGVGRSGASGAWRSGADASVHVYEGPWTADSERWTKWGDEQRDWIHNSFILNELGHLPRQSAGFVACRLDEDGTRTIARLRWDSCRPGLKTFGWAPASSTPGRRPFRPSRRPARAVVRGGVGALGPGRRISGVLINVTTAGAPQFSDIHDRQPAIIDPGPPPAIRNARCQHQMNRRRSRPPWPSGRSRSYFERAGGNRS